MTGLPASVPTTSSIVVAVRDAEWLAHRYDPEGDAVHFVPLPREAHDRTTFLIDEHLPKGVEPLVVRRADAIAATAPAAPIHFVFHAAFCCSTLVARAFDRPGWAMGLKEPTILNDIVGWRRRGGKGPDMATVLDGVLTLLARPFAAGEAVIVKPSNIVNSLAEPIMTLRPNARAILLYAPLRTYLGSVAKKGMDGRLWVRTLLLGLMDDRAVDLGFSPRDLLGQTDLQIAAVGWLAQQTLFARLVARFPDRVRTLSSEGLTAKPEAAMAALASLFDMPLDDDVLAEIVSGPAFSRHSKLDQSFATEDRQREHRDAASIHADELEKVAIWAEAVAKALGIAMTAPAPLLTST